MPVDDMDSVPGLEENHKRALAGKLGITNLGALAKADQRAVHTTLMNLKPRPSLARIAAWQEHARSVLAEAAGDTSAWHTAASFAVIFAQRQVNGVWEHRIEAEQTEVEPAPEVRQWPGWDCGPLCHWMLAWLAGPAAEAGSAAAPAEAAAGRAELRIDSVTIIDAVREQDLIRADGSAAAPPADLRLPVRLRLAVHGGRSGQQLRAAVWFRRRAAPGWSPHDPVIVPPSGQVEFDLSSVPVGGHDIRLLAWATEPGATLAAVTLPTLAFTRETLTRETERADVGNLPG